MAEQENKLGPDPVWGAGAFVVGLLIMATGGAFTWHYVFNVGEGIMMLGAIVFLFAVMLSWHHQRPGGIVGAFEDWKATLPWPQRAAEPTPVGAATPDAAAKPSGEASTDEVSPKSEPNDN